MKAGWEVVSLGSLAKLENGDRGENYPSKSTLVPNGVPFINAGHLENGVVDPSSTTYITEAHFHRLRSGKVQRGDLLFCLRGSLGKFASIDHFYHGAIASSLVIVRTTKTALQKYLKYYFESNLCSEEIQTYSNGAAQPNLSAGNLKKFKIPLPPLEEQKQIVSVLDRAFAGIERAAQAARKNRDNARELFETTLNASFAQKGEGWVETTLGECFRLKSGDGLTAKAMKAGDFDVYGGNGIAGKHNEANLSGEHVIVGRVGALCGNARYISGDIWLTDNAFKVVDFKYDFDLKFLMYLLNHKKLRSLARQSAQPVISNSSLKALELEFPLDVEVQRGLVRSIASVKAQTQRLEALYQQKLDALDELKQSLLQKAFAGELTAATLLLEASG